MTESCTWGIWLDKTLCGDVRALAYFGEHWITVLPVYSMEPKPVGRRVRRSFCHPRDDQSNLRGYRRRKVLNAGGFSGQPQSGGSSLPLHLGYQLGIPHSRLRLGSVYVLLLVETRLRELVEVKGQEQYKKFPTCLLIRHRKKKKARPLYERNIPSLFFFCTRRYRKEISNTIASAIPIYQLESVRGVCGIPGWYQVSPLPFKE